MELQIIDTETNNSSVLTSEKKTELQLVYTDRNYPPVKLIGPTTLGYIHIAAEVQPRSLPFSLFMPQRREKSELLTELLRFNQGKPRKRNEGTCRFMREATGLGQR